MRKCPICKTIMLEDAYLVNKAAYLSDMYVARRDAHFVKKEAPIEVAICPHCGHIELFYDTNRLK